MLLPILRRCGRFLRCERAVSALEYAILAGVVLAGVGVAIVAFVGDVGNAIEGLGDEIATGAGTTQAEDANLSPQ
jgi:Flp pilus assembly pilin Flp